MAVQQVVRQGKGASVVQVEEEPRAHLPSSTPVSLPAPVQLRALTSSAIFEEARRRLEEAGHRWD